MPASTDAALTALGMATQPEIGVPLAIVTHPRFSAQVVLVAFMAVMIVLAIGTHLIGFTGVSTLLWLGAGACLVGVLLLRRKKRAAPPRGN